MAKDGRFEKIDDRSFSSMYFGAIHLSKERNRRLVLASKSDLLVESKSDVGGEF